MNPTLYDILGVSRDASADQIKRAWRDAADRFDPGTGSSGAQFRLFNEAAEVLLDPQRRAAYDAQLAGQGPGQTTENGLGGGLPDHSRQAVATDHPVTAAVRVRSVAELRSGSPAPAAPTAPAGAPGPAWVPALAVLAAVLLLAAVVLGVIDLRRLAETRDVEDAAREAPAAAERAAAAILSYDAKSLDADEKAAARYMTDGYRRQYTDTFDKLVRPSATELHAHVEAQVKASSLVHADPHRADVLLFVDQTTTSTAHGGEPQVALNRVQMSMVEQDGTWLVADITSY